jgi:arylsulfatase
LKVRSIVVVCVLASLLGVACRGGAPEPASSARAPLPATPAAGTGFDVLLITIDTLRADHLGSYGYPLPTSPRMDALARQATVFDNAYTYWPKTRASMIMMFTGRRPSLNGYSKTHPVLLGFNATIASVLKQAGYRTAAWVDNANVAAQHGYDKGFDSYVETWQDKRLPTEMDRARAISDGAIGFLQTARAEPAPFFLWLHYVNPHAPYEPPAPFDTAFLPPAAERGPRLRVVKGYKGGVHERLVHAGSEHLGEYVARYDGEIAAADREVGRVLDALDASGRRGRTLIVLTSDHGESLGEHEYFFDHGEDLFEPSLRIPLLVVAPGAPQGRRNDAFASTLDVLPTILDAVKVSYPPDIVGESLYGAVRGEAGPARERLFAQNDYNLRGSFSRRFKLVATPVGDRDQWALYDRQADPGETRNLRQRMQDAFRLERRELDLYFERMDREWMATRRRVEGQPGETRMTPEACEQMKALGYVLAGCG